MQESLTKDDERFLRGQRLLDSPRKQFSREQAACICHCSLSTIRRSIEDGHLIAYKPSGKIVIYREDLVAYMKRRLTSVSGRRHQPEHHRHDDEDTNLNQLAPV